MTLIPKLYQVLSIDHDTHDVFTITLSSEEGDHTQHFLPGQFNMLYQYGFGEVAISICGNSKEHQILTHTIRAVGSVTKSLQQLKPGDEIGVRGPYGTHWPLNKKNCDVLVIAGGIGLAALRSAMIDLAERSKEYQKITLLYGSRTVNDLLYTNDLEDWKRRGLDIHVTLDMADSNWNGRVGVVTSLIAKNVRNPANTLVMICGPEIMMQFALHELMGAQVDENNIYLSMERNMQCALGFCGHCQFGPYFVCKDGPVFPYSAIKNLLRIKEI